MLVPLAGLALKTNITTLGPLVLPWSEQLLFGLDLISRKMFRGKKAKPYIPDFKLAFDHFCIHTGGCCSGSGGAWAAYKGRLVVCAWGSARRWGSGRVHVGRARGQGTTTGRVGEASRWGAWAGHVSGARVGQVGTESMQGACAETR